MLRYRSVVNSNFFPVRHELRMEHKYSPPAPAIHMISDMLQGQVLLIKLTIRVSCGRCARRMSTNIHS